MIVQLPFNVTILRSACLRVVHSNTYKYISRRCRWNIWVHSFQFSVAFSLREHIICPFQTNCAIPIRNLLETAPGSLPVGTIWRAKRARSLEIQTIKFPPCRHKEWLFLTPYRYRDINRNDHYMPTITKIYLQPARQIKSQEGQIYFLFLQ